MWVEQHPVSAVSGAGFDRLALLYGFGTDQFTGTLRCSVLNNSLLPATVCHAHLGDPGEDREAS